MLVEVETCLHTVSPLKTNLTLIRIGLSVTSFFLLFVPTPLCAAKFTFGDQTLTVPDGFVVERVAQTQMVPRPIEMDFDDKGRLYVSDSSGTNDKPDKQLVDRPHRVVRLEDINGDGVYDKQTIFADRMMFPEGVMWHNGSLYVGAPPSIWKLTDTNNDGVADERVEWFQGKTLTGCANDLHGPYLGPDGWFYWCKGAFATQKHAIQGKPDWATRAAHIFRARPDGTGLEPVMTGGMDNPVEVAFTAGGERLFTTTFVYRPEANQRDGVVHAIYGGLYGKPNDVLSGHAATGDLMPVMSVFGAAAPCGLTRYRSEVFGKGYRDNFFVSLFNVHKITRHELKPDGSTFTSKTTDFMTSDGPDFHPTDVLEDADGSLVVLDTGGWYKLCCPTSQLAKPDILGAIYRVRRLNSPAIPDPRGLAIDWNAQSPSDLTRHLGSPRPFITDKAIHELARRGADSVSALKQSLSSQTNPSVRSLTLWALTQIENPEARKVVHTAILDENSLVASTAIHSVSIWRDRSAVPFLLKVLVDGKPETQRVAAEALGRIGDKSVVPHLLALANSPHDRPLEHSIIFALIELNDPVATRQGMVPPTSPTKIQAALIAVDQMASGNIQPKEVLPFLDDTSKVLNSSPVTKKTARWIANHHPDWGSALSGFLSQQIMAEKGDLKAQIELARFVAELAAAPEVQSLIANIAGDSTAPTTARKIVLESMVLTKFKEAPKTWITVITALINSRSPELLEPAIKAARWMAARKTDSADLKTALLNTGSKPEIAAKMRLGSLSSIHGGLQEISADLFQFLLSETEVSHPVMQKKMASEILAQARLNHEKLVTLATKIKEVGPLELGTLLAAFDQTTNDVVVLHLIDSLRHSKSITSLRADQLKPRFLKYSKAIQAKGDEVLALLEVNAAEQKSRLTSLVSLTKDGDVRRGQTIFNSTKAACSTCHAIGYLGGELGPDLTAIGTIRTELDLLESIVFPSASFVRSFEPIRVLTRQGEDHTGILTADNHESITLATGPETNVIVNRSDIVEMRPSSVSVMPQGLDQQLTQQELGDLLAFLKNTKWGAQ